MSACFRMTNDVWRRVLTVLWEAMPETSTHIGNVAADDMVRMRFRLKLAGFDYRRDEEIVSLMMGAEKLGIINADPAHEQHWRGTHPDEAVDWGWFA